MERPCDVLQRRRDTALLELIGATLNSRNRYGDSMYTLIAGVAGIGGGVLMTVNVL